MSPKKRHRSNRQCPSAKRKNNHQKRPRSSKESGSQAKSRPTVRKQIATTSHIPPATLLGLASISVHGAITVPIPHRPLGFVYTPASQNSSVVSSVDVAAYLDPTCPDSKAVFPTLLEVAQAYSPSQVKLRVYLFPLPYHRNSHTISKAAHVLNNYSGSKAGTNTAFSWLNMVYNNIAKLATSGTVNENDVQVLDFLADLATDLTGISKQSFIDGVGDRNIDMRTRVEWKYGCTRGVYGTPMFTVNDVFLDASSWDFNAWKSLLDQLV